MRKTVLVVLLTALAPLLLHAQSFKPVQFEEYKLDNGLTVILHVDRTAPTCETYLLYKVGSKDEQPGLTGFAHFFEHLMFEGTKNIERGRIDKLITAAGGVLNASTSFDRTDYFFKVPINQLELALWIESERMLSLVVDSIGIETQRKVVKEELKQRYEGRPYGTLFDNLCKLTFKGSQYEWTPIGEAQHINQAKYEEFMKFHRTFYYPNNACLVVGGDIDIDKTKKMVKDYFGSIPSGPEPKRIPVIVPDQKEARSLEVKEDVTPLPAYLESYITVDQRNPDTYALSLLSDVLFSGESSRMQQRLVENDQLAVQVGDINLPMDKAGMFAFFVIGNAGTDFPTIEKAVRDELDRIVKEGVTAEEFEKVRTNTEATFVRSYRSLDTKLRALANYSLLFGNTALVNEEYGRYMAVTRDDLKRVAQKYLKPERRNTIRYVVPERAN